MKVYINKLPSECISVHGPYYEARAVENKGKLEVVRWIVSHENIPSFISMAENILKEEANEIDFHGLWKKTRDDFMKEEYVHKL
jgi:hypothetical protein